MSNHLSQETSPYLIQHAENPVDWYPWGNEAFSKAQKEDKPIFLSIGYAACHWCHVMAHESFEDIEIARLLNQNFISIKVDREERPDIDAIYMDAVVAMTGQGGWPMSLFLSPDGRPFFGGTYFPPSPRFNMPAFRQVLESIQNSWHAEREQINTIGQQITDHLRQTGLTSLDPKPLQPHDLESSTQNLIHSYDWKDGGWGSAPKFPQPLAIDFLLAQATRGNLEALKVSNHALLKMGQGGMYDLIGGGFHRYSTDSQWLIPHFEKMLYDNAQLSRAYLHAFLITKNPLFKSTCEQTLQFIQSELTNPQGGFYSSLDADSDGGEGSYYTWTISEIREAIPDPMDQKLFKAAFGITEKGNFEGKTILRQTLPIQEISQKFNIDPEQIPPRISSLLKSLQVLRNQRVRPSTDDKVILAWNASMLQTFAEAGRYLGNQAFTQVAMRNASFILQELYQNGRLFRSWRNGRANQAAFLEDYAALILALLSLYESDPNPKWFSLSQQLCRTMMENFSNPSGGFFDTSDDQPALLIRPKEIQDNATPCGNSLAAMALLKMFEFTGNKEYQESALGSLASVLAMAERYPTAFSFWLQGFDFALGPIQQVALLSKQQDDSMTKLKEVIFSAYRPRTVIASSDFPPAEGSPSILADRSPKNEAATAYVCEGFICKLPVNQPEDLAGLLA